MKKMMHLNGFVMFGPMNHSVGSWTHPDSNVAESFARPDIWQDVARTLERGKFDGLFFADTLAAFGNYRNRMDDALTHAIQFPMHDPMLVIPMLAAVTERLGFAATFMEVCHKLWNSWEPDAVVADKTSGIFVDASKVHSINHRGKWFSCPGISAVEPSPQGHPVLFQAGASEAGRDFCAKHAEAAFGVQLTTRALKSFADDMRERLPKFGRAPDSLKFIWGIQTIIGGTEEEAKRKHREFNELVPFEGGLALLSGHSNHDLSQYDLDEPIEDIQVEGIQGLLDIFTKMYKAGDLGKDKLTMREVGKIYGATIGCPQIVGTPEQVADQLQAILDETGGDGFNLTPSVMPDNFAEFVDEIVPVLQQRGVYRREYSGETFRDHLNQQTPG